MKEEVLRSVKGKTLSKGIISKMYALIKISDIADLLTGNTIF